MPSVRARSIISTRSPRASYAAWRGVDAALGRSLPAQLLSVGAGLALGTAAYAGVVLALRIPEARQIVALVRSRLRPPS